MPSGMAPGFLRKMGQGQTGSSPITSGTVAAPSGSAIGEFRGQLGEAMSGRVSLLLLDTMILGLILFYLWTRNAQGGG